MKARSVARELALHTLFQLDKGEHTLERKNLNDVILNTVRSLCGVAQEQLETAAKAVSDVTQTLIDHEVNHPDNESVPIDSPTQPVSIPTTKAMVDHLESVLAAAENIHQALYLPEVNALSQREDVQNYCWMLLKTVTNNQKTIDETIDNASTDWRVERIEKMDLLLLRLAVAEIIHSNDVDSATAINEILELAKRYTTEESRKFIHGILGQVTAQRQEAREHV